MLTNKSIVNVVLSEADFHSTELLVSQSTFPSKIVDAQQNTYKVNGKYVLTLYFWWWWGSPMWYSGGMATP